MDARGRPKIPGGRLPKHIMRYCLHFIFWSTPLRNFWSTDFARDFARDFRRQRSTKNSRQPLRNIWSTDFARDFARDFRPRRSTKKSRPASSKKYYAILSVHACVHREPAAKLAVCLFKALLVAAFGVGIAITSGFVDMFLVPPRGAGASRQRMCTRAPSL